MSPSMDSRTLEEISRQLGISEIEIIEPLVSRRNQVYLVQACNEEKSAELLTMKIFSGNDGADKCRIEQETISYLNRKRIMVPNVRHCIDNYLFMEYIPGKVLNTMVESLDEGFWLEGLAYWMAQLHGIKKEGKSFLKLDVNLRNFIWYDNRIYGIDFEETSLGDPREDLADLCFFILTNRPALTIEKDRMVRRLLAAYQSITKTSITEMGKFLIGSRNKAKLRRMCFQGHV